MTGGRPLSPAEHCWTFLCGLREAARYLAGRMNVVRHPYERWAAVQLPASVQSILFVCKGNICRSPLAEAYFRSVVEKDGRRITVRSAGLETTPGKPADAKAKAVAMEHRLSLDEHATTQVHMELLDQSDLIVVMEVLQKDRVQRLYPRSKGKVVLLGRFDSGGSLEIADPYGRASEDFLSCFQQVSRCCDNLAARIGVKNSIPSHSQILPADPKSL
jgi:protein-tyrosine phosphatase